MAAKGKVYKTEVRSAMMHGLEMMAPAKRQEVEQEVSELTMVRFSLGLTQTDRIRNESRRLNTLETKLELHGLDGLNMCREGKR